MNKKVYTYLVSDGNLYKIGKSIDPEKRLKQLKTANPACKLICYGEGVSEKYLHDLFFQKREKGEWFRLDENNLEKCQRLIIDGEQEFNYYDDYINKKITTEKRFINGEIKIVEVERNTYKLSDRMIKLNLSAKQKSIDLNKKYMINFGKYKGTKIIDMISEEQYQYCEWFLNTAFKDISKNGKKKDRKYKAFSWWVRIGYKEFLKNVE